MAEATDDLRYEMYLDFVIVGNVLSLEEASRRLNCEPDAAYQRGTPRGHAQKESKNAVWSVQSRLPEQNADLSELWTELASRLSPGVDYLRSLSGVEKTLYIVITATKEYPTLVLPLSMSEFSVSARAEIVIESYVDVAS